MRNIVLMLALVALPSVVIAGAPRPGGDQAISVQESYDLAHDYVYIRDTVMPRIPSLQAQFAGDIQTLHDDYLHGTLASNRNVYLGAKADYDAARGRICAAYKTCVPYPFRP